MQKTDGDDQLKYSTSVRLNDDRSARIEALQGEIEALTARNNSVEHQLAMARAMFERLKGAFDFQRDVIERQRLHGAGQRLHINRLQDQVATDQGNLELQRIEIRRLDAELDALCRNRDILEIELRARQAELAAIVNGRGYRALQLARRVLTAVRRPGLLSNEERVAPPSALPAPLEEPASPLASKSVAPPPQPTPPAAGEVAASPAEPPQGVERPNAAITAWDSGQGDDKQLEWDEVALPPADAFHWPELDFSGLPPASQRALVAAVQYRPRVRRHAFVVLPIIDWDFRYQRPQQIARQLAAAGHPVFYLRMSFSKVAKRRELHPGVIELALPGPVNLNPYRDSLDAALARRLAEVIALELRRDAIGCALSLVHLPFWKPLALALRDLLAMPVMYDCMDEHAGFSTNGAAMLAEENALIAAADVVVASSRRLQSRLAEQKDGVVLIRNAADVDHFGGVPPPSAEPGRPLTVGYYGAIADWFDSDLVAETARTRPDWNFTLVGNTDTACLAPLSGLPNICLVGEQPYSSLPDWLAQWDVCVIPFKITPLTAATDPVKVYEMLAAGRPIVATPMDELVDLASRGLVRLAATAEDMIAQVQAACAEDNDTRRTERRRFAAENSWSHRREELVRASRLPFPRASVVVVTYNNLELNRLCIESVLADNDYPDFEVIVVDNASTDGTPEFLRTVAERDTRVRLVLNSENRGFAGGNNDGVAASSGEYVCMLNNDTVVTGSWLSSLVRHLQDDPRLGLVGPVTNAISNEARIEVGYEYVADMPRWADGYCSMHRGELSDVPMLAFFCVAMRREVWNEVGPLDEGFRTGMFEDDDWNRRAREKGYRVALARDSFVHHWHNASLNRLSTPAYRRIYFENRRYFRRKWGEVPAPGESVAALLREIVNSAREGDGAVFFPASVGATPAQQHRMEQVRQQFDRLGITQIVELPVPADAPASRCFRFSGEREWLTDVPGLFLMTDSSNYDARDVLPPDIPCVFDWVEHCEQFEGDIDRFRWLQWRGVKEADVLSTPSWELRQIAVQHRESVLYLPDGRTDFEAPSEAPVEDSRWGSIRSNPAPVAAFCGPLSRAVDFALIGALADMRPDWQFVLVGPDIDGAVWHSDLDRLFNVQWLARDRPERYAWHADVVLLPWRGDERLPAPDVRDLMHAGVPVVACPHGQLDDIAGVRRAEDAAEFSAALAELRPQLATPELTAALRSSATGHTWHVVASRVFEAVAAARKRSV